MVDGVFQSDVSPDYVKKNWGVPVYSSPLLTLNPEQIQAINQLINGTEVSPQTIL